MSNTQNFEFNDSEKQGEPVLEDTIFLDQILWKQFQNYDDSEMVIRAWLGLQCRYVGDLVGGVVGGVVVLGDPEVGPFAPAAYWPDKQTPEPRMLKAAELVMAERRGVVMGEGDIKSVAYPFIIKELLYGVVAIQYKGSSKSTNQVMRQLQWGSGWIEALLLRRELSSDEELQENISVAFDLVASALEQLHFQDACNAVVTDLATRFSCDPVSIGFIHRDRTIVKAISHAAQFESRVNLIRDIGSAMDEAVDQGAVVIFPIKEGWEYRVTKKHAELILAHQVGSVLSIPLQANGKVIGALTFERPVGEDFNESIVELCDGIASIIGPILEEKRLNDRSIFSKIGEVFLLQFKRLFGPHYFGRKLATLVIVMLVTFFSIVTDDYRVTAETVIEGLVQRTIIVPFDGYLDTQLARAGEVVTEGQVLATLDNSELALERLRWSTTRRQHLSEFDRALASRERAEAKIVLTRIKQAEAQINLLDEQLSRTVIKAPFNGVIVSGDLSQSVGAAVQRGEELFNIAPLHEYRVILEVDETDIKDIKENQVGSLRLAASPEESLDFTVIRITPIAEQSEGRNFFRVEAKLHKVSQNLRPGMEGVGKIYVDERLLIRAWAEKLVNWLQLMLWKWLP